MHNLQEVLDKVAQESTLIQSLKAFIAGLRQSLAAEVAKCASAFEAQDKVEQIFSTVDANAASIHDAIVVNTPSEQVTSPANSSTNSASTSDDTSKTADPGSTAGADSSQGTTTTLPAAAATTSTTTDSAAPTGGTAPADDAPKAGGDGTASGQ